MKIKIQQKNSKIKIKMNERKYRLKKWFSRRRNKVLEKGHEKMTIMFIPHNEEKIKTFQISNFIFIFFVVFFVCIVTIAGVAFHDEGEVQQKEKQLLSDYKGVKADLHEFERLINSVIDLMNDVKPEVEDVYQLTAGLENDDLTDLWIYTPAEVLEKSENGEVISQPKDLEKLKHLQYDMICSANTMKTVKTFIYERGQVIQDTPSIVPNRGYITSLFGWRRSPFGFGRDFHTGIDIAAAEGTPIHATAPGVVETAGWGGGYGNMVKIKHKYGFETIYGHCVRLIVHRGQKIRKNQIVGYVGQTGSATGNHNHYEIRLGGKPINPYPYMTRMW